MYGICNVVGASIPRNTDSGTYIHVGPEIGVASTKAFTGQVTVLMLLALCVGQMRGTVDDATVERIVRELKNMPLYIKDVLGLADKIKNLSKIYTYARNFLYLGRGYNYPTALEGALKLKEISYIHAEGYPAAEMKLMKKTYIIPAIHVVTLQQKASLLAGSEINGGGNKGDYTVGTQESRGFIWGDDE